MVQQHMLAMLQGTLHGLQASTVRFMPEVFNDWQYLLVFLPLLSQLQVAVAGHGIWVMEAWVQ
jgi:hypothetical protein